VAARSRADTSSPGKASSGGTPGGLAALAGTGPPGRQCSLPTGQIGPDPDIEVTGLPGPGRHQGGLMRVQLEHDASSRGQPLAGLVEEQIERFEAGIAGDESRARFVIADLGIEVGPFRG